jgi:hypothetical protein
MEIGYVQDGDVIQFLILLDMSRIKDKYML